MPCAQHRGVRGICDRYKYLDEKRDTLERLAGLIGGIVKTKVMKES